MLKFFFRTKEDKTPLLQTPDDSCPSGFIRNLSASELLQTDRRQAMLDQIWEQTAIPKALFQSFYICPIQRYAELVQELPASESHHHSYLGGLLDHTLELLVHALKLRQGYMLPAGSPPEDQAQQADAWTAGIFYGGLLHDIGKVAVDFVIETVDGTLWHPWQGMLTKPYRFRYVIGRDYQLHNAAAGLLYNRILDPDIMDWLADFPEVWRSLIYLLAGNYGEAGTLGEIVAKADCVSSGQNIGANPATIVKATPGKQPLHQHFLRTFKWLLSHEFTLNVPGGAAWLTQDALWLVSKRVIERAKSKLLEEGVSGIPTNNTSIFDELQAH